MCLVTWTVIGKRNGLLVADASDAYEHKRARLRCPPRSSGQGVPDTCVEAFNMIDLSRVAVPIEEHDRLMSAKDAQIAALEARPQAFAVAFVTNDHDEVLLIRNRKRGGWELPGGHVEPNEDPRAAALREAMEEAGVVPSLDRLPCAVLHGARGVSIVYRGRADGVPVPGDDADDAAWCPREWIATAELSDISSRRIVLAWADEHVSTKQARPRIDDPIVRRQR